MFRVLTISGVLIAASGAAGFGLTNLHSVLMTDSVAVATLKAPATDTKRFVMPRYTPAQPVSREAPAVPLVTSPLVQTVAVSVPTGSVEDSIYEDSMTTLLSAVVPSPSLVTTPDAAQSTHTPTARAAVAPPTAPSSASAPVLVAQVPAVGTAVYSTQGDLVLSQDYVVGVYR